MNGIFMVFLCAAIGTATGLVIMKRYRRDKEYTAEVCDVIAELKRNISYRRDSAASVLNGLDIKSALLKRNVGEYVAFASSKDGKLDISRGYLSAARYGKVCALFRSLGRSDDKNQLSELDAFAAEFAAEKADAAARSEKFGPLAVKLGFLFGLAAGVLFL